MHKFKTLRLFRLFGRWSLAEDLKVLGEYEPDPDDEHGPGTVSEVSDLFTGETVGLEEPVDVHLIQVDSDLVAEQQISQWMKDNDYEHMQLKHAIAIALQHPKEQENNSIWALGSVRNRFVFVLSYQPPSDQPYGKCRRVFSVTRRGHFFGGGCLFGAIKTSVK